MSKKLTPEQHALALFPDIFIGKETEEVANPYTGSKTVLTPDAVAVYDLVKGAEMLQLYHIVRAGLDWFKEHYAKEYMVLLD
jgi:hypothetical protein